MEETRQEKFLREIMGSDLEFYDRFLTNLSEEQLQKFLDENPDFFME